MTRLFTPVVSAVGALVLLLVLFSRPAWAEGDADVQALAQRYIAWRGGDAFERLQTLHATGRLTTSGLNGGLEVWASSGGRQWERDSVQGIITTDGASPRRAWRTNLSGQVIPLDAADARARRLAAQALFASLLRTPLARKPDETLDGQVWRVIEADYPDETFDLFLSADGALHAIRVSHNGASKITRYDDWRFVGGVRLPFVEQVGSASDGDTRRFVVMELDRRLPATLSRPPRDLVRVAHKGSSSPWMPFQLFGGRRIYLPVTINGHPFQALLDSGAETTFVDGAAARAIGLRTIGQMQVKGSGGSSDSGLATGVAISVGPATLSPVTVSVMDLEPIAKALDTPLKAILGQEVFAAFVVDIDFEQRRIAFRDPATFIPPRGAIRLPLTPAGGDRVTRVSVEGRTPVDVYFDLGNGSCLDLFPAYWQAQHLLDDRRSSEMLSGGAGGQRPVKVATVHTLDVAGVVFRDVPTNFPPPGDSTADTRRVQGNLGLSILSRFRMMADFSHDALYLMPEPDAVARPFDKDRAGLTTVREAEALRVTFVAPHSPSEEAGFKVGDLIALIDGQPIGPGFPQSALARWRYGAAGRRVQLSLSDHRTLTLELRDYY